MKLHNPVFSSEVKVRMRGWKTALGISIYMLVLIGLALMYFLFSVVLPGRTIRPGDAADIGRTGYILLASFQFALLIFIVPAQTAGVISGEREKQTLDLLLVTRMSPAAIIGGKLLSSLGYVVLLILSSMPVFSLVFLFGGIRFLDVATLFFFYLIMAFSAGVIGVFCSTYMRRTISATVVAYLMILAFGIGTLIIGGFELSYQAYAGQQMRIAGLPAPDTTYPIAFYLNPALALADLLAGQMGSGGLGLLGIRGAFGGATPVIPIWGISSIAIASIAVVLLILSVLGLRPGREVTKTGTRNGKKNAKKAGEQTQPDGV